jgi:predicted ArsR family transcriptional regulator
MATLSLLFWLLVPLLVVVAIIDLATASESRRARILRRDGLSQQAIANRLGVSRYKVRQWLVA